MDYRTLYNVLRREKTALFTLRDLQNLFPEANEKTLKNNLTRWLARGDCLRLRRNLYELMDPASEGKIPDLYIANRLYEPSYVSLETALSIYSLIPDVAVQVTSVTTRPTRTFRNRYGSFFFRTCKRAAFTGYRLILYEGYKVWMGDPEKALVDFLYFRLRSGIRIDLEEERLNSSGLKKINWEKATRFAALYHPKIVEALKQCKKKTQC